MLICPGVLTKWKQNTGYLNVFWARPVPSDPHFPKFEWRAESSWRLVFVSLAWVGGGEAASNRLRCVTRLCPEIANPRGRKEVTGGRSLARRCLCGLGIYLSTGFIWFGTSRGVPELGATVFERNNIVWVNIKPLGDRRFSPCFHLPGQPILGTYVFDPRPYWTFLKRGGS